MAATDEEVRSPADEDIQILKWKVRTGSMIFKGSVLALYVEAKNKDAPQSKKLKAHNTGIVSQIKVEEGMVVHPGQILLIVQPQTNHACSHPTIMKDMCADCGADLREELGLAGDRKQSASASVAMVHSIPELIVSQEQAMEIGREDEHRLLKQKKLVLLVDLDQTLIHTTNDNIPANLKDVKHFQLWHSNGYMWYHTRFRPFTRQFLEAVSKMYELHICTFGVRMYAHIIARLLDPEEKYFSHRILSRDECFDALSKTANLKALFPCGDKMVGIIDDREDVWNYAPNLIHVKPYRFFQGTADINAPPGLTKSEHDNEPIAHKVVEHSKEGEAKEENEKKDTITSKEQKDEISNDSAKTKGQPSEDDENKNNQLNKDSSKDLSDLKEDSQLIETSDKQENSRGKDLSKVESEKPQGDVEMETDGNTVPPNIDRTKEVTESKENSDSTKEKLETITEHDVKKFRAEEEKGSDNKLEHEEVGKEEEIEWDDEDDFLLHLEEVLTRIHKAYYEMYEQSQHKGSKELPDLKNIIPYVRKKVLKGANIVFSGMFPLNMPAEKSRAYTVAKALGANIQNDIVSRKRKSGVNPEATTHLVAAKPGTGKYKSALKTKGIHMVSGDWLWACNERWEWVDEKLYPLSNKDVNLKGSQEEKGTKKGSRSNKRKNDEDIDKGGDEEDEDPFNAGGEDSVTKVNKRQKLNNSRFKGSSIDPEASSSIEDIETEETFANSFNPLYSFSDEDIEFMGKEVDEIMDEEGDSSDETDDEREARVRRKVLGRVDDSDSDSESLSGDFPRGWKMRRKSFSPKHKEDIVEEQKKTDAEDDDETENELDRYQKNMAAFSPDCSSSETDDDNDSVGSVDDEIAEAVEKEFLSS